MSKIQTASDDNGTMAIEFDDDSVEVVKDTDMLKASLKSILSRKKKAILLTLGLTVVAGAGTAIYLNNQEEIDETLEEIVTE